MWEKFKENIAALIAVAVFAWIAGNVQGTSTNAQIASDVAEIKKAVGELKASGKVHDSFDKCTELRLFAIESGVKPPACPKGE